MNGFERVVELLLSAKKGMTSRELADALGSTVNVASKYADRAYRRGLINKLQEPIRSTNGGGRTMRYFAPQFVAGATRENQNRLVAEIERLRKVRRNRRRAERMRGDLPMDGYADRPFVHRLVPADQAPPFGVVQPKWVFDLAQSS